MDYAGGAITAPLAAADPSKANLGKERVNPLTGNMVRPWFSANADGKPQSPSQWAGEVLVRGAELAPWFMGAGEV